MYISVTGGDDLGGKFKREVEECFFLPCTIQFEPNYLFRHGRLGREREGGRGGKENGPRSVRTINVSMCKL